MNANAPAFVPAARTRDRAANAQQTPVTGQQHTSQLRGDNSGMTMSFSRTLTGNNNNNINYNNNNNNMNSNASHSIGSMFSMPIPNVSSYDIVDAPYVNTLHHGQNIGACNMNNTNAGMATTMSSTMASTITSAMANTNYGNRDWNNYSVNGQMGQAGRNVNLNAQLGQTNNNYNINQFAARHWNSNNDGMHQAGQGGQAAQSYQQMLMASIQSQRGYGGYTDNSNNQNNNDNTGTFNTSYQARNRNMVAIVNLTNNNNNNNTFRMNNISSTMPLGADNNNNNNNNTMSGMPRQQQRRATTTMVPMNNASSSYGINMLSAVSSLGQSEMKQNDAGDANVTSHLTGNNNMNDVSYLNASHSMSSMTDTNMQPPQLESMGPWTSDGNNMTTNNRQGIINDGSSLYGPMSSIQSQGGRDGRGYTNNSNNRKNNDNTGTFNTSYQPRNPNMNTIANQTNNNNNNTMSGMASQQQSDNTKNMIDSNNNGGYGGGGNNNNNNNNRNDGSSLYETSDNIGNRKRANKMSHSWGSGGSDGRGGRGGRSGRGQSIDTSYETNNNKNNNDNNTMSSMASQEQQRMNMNNTNHLPATMKQNVTGDTNVTTNLRLEQESGMSTMSTMSSMPSQQLPWNRLMVGNNNMTDASFRQQPQRQSEMKQNDTGDTNVATHNNESDNIDKAFTDVLRGIFEPVSDVYQGTFVNQVNCMEVGTDDPLISKKRVKLFASTFASSDGYRRKFLVYSVDNNGRIIAPGCLEAKELHSQLGTIAGTVSNEVKQGLMIEDMKFLVDLELETRTIMSAKLYRAKDISKKPWDRADAKGRPVLVLKHKTNGERFIVAFAGNKSDAICPRLTQDSYGDTILEIGGAIKAAKIAPHSAQNVRFPQRETFEHGYFDAKPFFCGKKSMIICDIMPAAIYPLNKNAQLKPYEQLDQTFEIDKRFETTIMTWIRDFRSAYIWLNVLKIEQIPTGSERDKTNKAPASRESKRQFLSWKPPSNIKMPSALISLCERFGDSHVCENKHEMYQKEFDSKHKTKKCDYCNYYFEAKNIKFECEKCSTTACPKCSVLSRDGKSDMRQLVALYNAIVGKNRGASIKYVNDLNLKELKIDDFKEGNVKHGILFAAIHLNEFELVKILIEKGCDVNFTDMDITSVLLATSNGNLSMIQMLNDNGFDWSYLGRSSDYSFRFGLAPLMIACYDGNVDCMRYIKEKIVASKKEIMEGVRLAVENNQINIIGALTPDEADQSKIKPFLGRMRDQLPSNEKDIINVRRGSQGSYVEYLIARKCVSCDLQGLMHQLLYQLEANDSLKMKKKKKTIELNRKHTNKKINDLMESICKLLEIENDGNIKSLFEELISKLESNLDTMDVIDKINFCKIKTACSKYYKYLFDCHLWQQFMTSDNINVQIHFFPNELKQLLKEIVIARALTAVTAQDFE